MTLIWQSHFYRDKSKEPERTQRPGSVSEIKKNGTPESLSKTRFLRRA
jgi:hypothetical protein